MIKIIKKQEYIDDVPQELTYTIEIYGKRLGYDGDVYEADDRLDNIIHLTAAQLEELKAKLANL